MQGPHPFAIGRCCCPIHVGGLTGAVIVPHRQPPITGPLKAFLKERGGELGIHHGVGKPPGRVNPLELPVPVELQRPHIDAQLTVLQRRHQGGEHGVAIGVKMGVARDVQGPGPWRELPVPLPPGLCQRHRIENIPGDADVISDHVIVRTVGNREHPNAAQDGADQRLHHSTRAHCPTPSLR